MTLPKWKGFLFYDFTLIDYKLHYIKHIENNFKLWHAVGTALNKNINLKLNEKWNLTSWDL